MQSALIKLPKRNGVAPASPVRWRGSALHSETTLHQISPYIGKIKSSIAAELIGAFTEPGHTIYDPFCGSGTVGLEAWLAGRHIVANDLSPYALLLTEAKLKPYESISAALKDIALLAPSAILAAYSVRSRPVPGWVRVFFHPRTLSEILGWIEVLKEYDKSFLLACLMGILHHQRPGYLSFPSSHTVPYLRTKRFPSRQYPQLYSYRNVRDRLEAKVRRALRRTPQFDYSLHRSIYRASADNLIPPHGADAIITSPPYMHQLDYGRDNRLRLWFLGTEDWKNLDKQVSPSESQFLDIMRRCFELWLSVLRPAGSCVLVLGDIKSHIYRKPLPAVLSTIATKEIGGYRIKWKHTEHIPEERRVRRGKTGSIRETILAMERMA